LKKKIAMSTSRYVELIVELCKLAQIPTAQAHEPTADFVVDEIGFTVIESGHNGEEALTLFCDFGSPPTHHREQILAQLLYMNLAMQGINTPAFAMNPDTGHVLLTRRIVIDDLSASDVLHMMADHATHAMDWRKHQYLQVPSQSSAPRTRKSPSPPTRT
jgi:hypothetical protein